MSDKVIGIGIAVGALAILYVAYNSMKRSDARLQASLHGYGRHRGDRGRADVGR